MVTKYDKKMAKLLFFLVLICFLGDRGSVSHRNNYNEIFSGNRNWIRDPFNKKQLSNLKTTDCNFNLILRYE